MPPGFLTQERKKTPPKIIFFRKTDSENHKVIQKNFIVSNKNKIIRAWTRGLGEISFRKTV